MKDELTVYTKPGCPWCMAITGHLLNEGYDFTEIDILANEEAGEEMKELSGQGLVPTVRWRDTVLGDCRVQDLQRLLQESGIRPW